MAQQAIRGLTQVLTGTTPLSALVDASSGGQVVVANSSNVPTYVTMSGDIAISDTGVTSIASGVIVNADVNASAAIDFSKLASLTSGNILVGNGSNVATSVAVTGDIAIDNAGLTSIAAGVIVDADINASAAISLSKLAEAVLQADGGQALTADWTVDGGGTFGILVHKTPTSAQDVVNKAYADSIGSGFGPKRSARVATTAVLQGSPTYNNGTSGVGATLTSTGGGTSLNTAGIDGITDLAVGERILVKNQASALQNGIYEVTTVGVDSSVEYVLTRTTDFDDNPNGEIRPGDTVPVEEGTANGGRGYYQDTFDSGDAVGTDAISFSVFPTQNALTASNGVDLIADDIQLDIDGLSTATIEGADSIAFFDSSAGGNTHARTTITNFLSDLGIPSGTITVPEGGTGVTSITSGALIYGNGTSAIQETTLQTDGTNFYTPDSASGSTTEIILTTGNYSVGANSSGTMELGSGLNTGSGSSGSVEFRSGNTTGAGASGNNSLYTGSSTSGNSGDVFIRTGAAGGTAGNIIFQIDGTTEVGRIEADGLDLVTGATYQINDTTVLSATALGSGVVGSSLTSVGTIGTGVWNGTTIAVGFGGTGVTSLTAGALFYGNGTSPLEETSWQTDADDIFTPNSASGSNSLGIRTGTSTSASDPSGDLDYATGAASAGTANTGAVNITTGNSTGGNSGSITIGTGTAGGTVGDVIIQHGGAELARFESDGLDLASGNSYQINDTTVLNATTLGSGVVSSSLTSVGTIGTGTWQGTAVGAQYGGTGIDGSSAANGTLLIGNGSGYTLATLTAGTGINIVEGSGSITISTQAATISFNTRVATVAALPGSPTYNNGTAGVGATLTSTGGGTSLNSGSGIDGITDLAISERILVRNQSNQEENGIYAITTVGVDSSVEYVLTRVTDFDEQSEMDIGVKVIVAEGSVYERAVFTHLGDSVSSTNPVPGTDGLLFQPITNEPGNGIEISSLTDGLITINLDGTSNGTSGLKLTSSGLAISDNIAGTGLSLASGVLSVDSTVITTSDYVTEETPSGLVNGSNTAYTLANTPVAGSVRLFQNGLRLETGGGLDFTISGANITFNTAPETGDSIVADYLIA